MSGAVMLPSMSFLTVFGRAAVPSARGLWSFPIVGAGLGLAVGAVWWGAGELWPPLVAALLAVAADAGLTGLLHLDGLSDSADGLLPPLDRERRLAVMRDPAVGAFGAVTLVLVLGLRVAAFASIAVAPRVILTAGALWAVSRAVMAVVILVMPYARAEGGLASAFVVPGRSAARAVAPALIGGLLAFPLAAVGCGWAGVVAVLCAVAAAGLVVLFARRRIGGFTGDVLGAMGVVAETVGLLVVAAW